MGVDIRELLKGEYGARISIGSRWLVVERDPDDLVVYVVRERKFGAKTSIILTYTYHEEEAVAALIEE